LNVWIDDDTNIQVSDIRSRVRRLHTEIDFIMLDYLQIIQPPKHLQRANDNEKIGYNSTHLKFLNREMKIPVIACAQLNRSPDKRRDTRPQLSDLRQSGQIEQDADIVAFIHRPPISDESVDSGMAEIIMAKQRNGPTGTFQLAFMSQFTKFATLYNEAGEEKWYDK
jgi:replicative DNA helicase